MNMQKIRGIAKKQGVAAANLSKTALIRIIQRAEGNNDCFATAYRDECNQVNCLWREDCIKAEVDCATNAGFSGSLAFDETLRRAKTSLYQESGLQNAFYKNEFCLNYLPVVVADSNEITGFEALLRWKHPEKGQVLAAEFISVAEGSGLIIPLGRWVVREACRQMRLWHELFPEKSYLTISVNISSRELTQDFAETIKQILNETGLNSCSLQLEITERVITSNPEVSAKVLSELKALGIKVQMDDFGTGYSSLGYLYVFPLDALKIEQSFVQSMCSKTLAMDIVKTIISMAHNMKMAVIAEGVETPEQLEELRKLKCDYYQGYWFSKPLGRKEAEALLDTVQ